MHFGSVSAARSNAETRCFPCAGTQPRGWRCEGCGHERHAALKQRAVLRCNRCKRQVSLTAGTIFHSNRPQGGRSVCKAAHTRGVRGLPRTTWFLSIYHLAQSKGGISSIELGRRLGVRQGTAWLMKHKLMQAPRSFAAERAERCDSSRSALGRQARPLARRRSPTTSLGRGRDHSGTPAAPPQAHRGQGLPQERGRKARQDRHRRRRQRGHRWLVLLAGGRDRRLPPLADAERCGSSAFSGSGRQAARWARFTWVNTALGNISCATSVQKMKNYRP